MAPVDTSSRPRAMLPRSCRLASLIRSLRGRLSVMGTSKIPPCPLVHISQVSSGFAQLIERAFSDCGRQGAIDRSRHPFLIAADVDESAVADPLLKFHRPRGEAMLYVDLLRLISREGDVNTRKCAR